VAGIDVGLLIALLLATSLVQQAPADIVQQGRALVRRGLLSDAELLLAPLVDQDHGEWSAHAWLLLGNIAYERGDASRALHCYSQALEQPGVSPDVADAVAGNTLMAMQRLRRQAELAGRLRWLLGALAAVTAAGAIAIGLLARQRPATSSST
jgi:tetratricopeptide (TPR) repeat protein